MKYGDPTGPVRLTKLESLEHIEPDWEVLFTIAASYLRSTRAAIKAGSLSHAAEEVDEGMKFVDGILARPRWIITEDK